MCNQTGNKIPRLLISHQRFRSQAHNAFTRKVHKIALSLYDDKRTQLMKHPKMKN